MSIVNQETVETILKGSESALKVVGEVSSELATEAINLFILLSFLNILKSAAVFVVYFIIRKYFEALPEEFKHHKKLGLTILLTTSIIFFTIKSFEPLTEITKAMVAPKIFLIEKGADLIKGK